MFRKALVVEDDPEMGLLLAHYLSRRGFEPTVLQTGKPAAPWTRQHHPDLILLDLMLPDIDGFDICTSLKLDRATNLIPLIMVTALVDHEDRVRGLEVGANYYLTKPFMESQLNAAIDRVLEWRDELENHGTGGEVHFRLRSDTHHLEELNHLLTALFLHTNLTERQARHLMMAVRELGSNAIEWGHRKQQARIVTVTYRIDNAKVIIVIRDTGPGFDRSNLPHAARPGDPFSHMEVREALGLRDGGLGILMARGLVDELHYNDAGNEVRLVKYFPVPAAVPNPLALGGAI
jgi:DNA-binding response OmpR family regulator